MRLSFSQLNDQFAALQREFNEVHDNQARVIILEEMNTVLKEMERALHCQEDMQVISEEAAS